jgi:iron complex transport system substrate-binding protein
VSDSDCGTAKAVPYVRVALVLACAFVWSAHAATPARIVSTSPSITETLFALGLGDRVVGVSRFCRYPEEALKLPKVGTFLKPDAELIAGLRPGLVIVHAGPNGIERQLNVLRIPFVAVERGTLASVYSSIRTIGEAAGVTERATGLIARLEQDLGRVRSAVAGRAPRRVLLIVGRQSGTLTDLIAVGRDSYLSDLVTLAGGVNVLADPGLPEYPRISMETVIRLAPDVIIDDGEMSDTTEDRRRRSAATLRLWKAAPVDAARGDRVYTVPSEAFTVPGPRVVEVAETLAMWLHGVTVRPSALRQAQSPSERSRATTCSGSSRMSPKGE